MVLTVGRMPTMATSSPTLTLPALDSPGDHGAAPGDREDVFDRHQERFVDSRCGCGM
jgi:hypothetical protein